MIQKCVLGKGGLNMLKDLFSKKKKYATIPNEQSKLDVPEGLMKKCKHCYKIYYRKELKKNLNVCPNCDFHNPLNAWERIDSLFDQDTFEEWNKDMLSNNPLAFPDYEEKLEKDRKKNDLNEGDVTSKGLINEKGTAVYAREARF